MNDYFKRAYEATESPPTVPNKDEEAAGKRKRQEEEAKRSMEEQSGKSESEAASTSTESSKKKKETVSKQQEASIPLSESESDSEEEWETVKEQKRFSIPPKEEMQVLPTVAPARAMTGRFNLVVKHALPADVNKQVKRTMVVINKILQNAKSYGSSFGWKGDPVLLPWKDEEVYENRALKEFSYQEFHDKKELQVKKGISYLKEYIYKWSLLPRQASEKDHGEGIKYFQIQVGWIFEEQSMIIPKKTIWQEVVTISNEDLERVAIKVSNTQAVEPVLAIQFLNSALHISGSWDDLGHADCTKDLTEIIRRILGEEIEFALLPRKFDGGKYSERTPQVMMVECDRKDVPQVQKDLVEAFAKIDNSEIFPQSKTTKKERIKNGLVTNWVAIPTFSSVASRSDISKVALYSQLMSQERAYRSQLLSCKVEGLRIGHLDEPAPSSSYLTPEVLLQMENEMILRGDTPVRHLIWDAVFKETKKLMVQSRIPADTSVEDMETRINEVKSHITWKEIIEEMQSKGVAVPYSSLPVPNPSKLSLRQKLLGLKSRKYAGENMLVFESVTVTDKQELLLTFKKHTAEEALAIAELIPLFIKHEMQVDPMFYCFPSLLQVGHDGYYNPLLRSGFLGLLKNTQEKKSEVSKKVGLPEFCRSMSGSELVKVFKCPGFSSLPMIADFEEDDLASLANTIATSPNPEKLPEAGMVGLESLLREANLIETSKSADEISEISNTSFDSKGSFNRFQINERAQVLAKQIQKKQAMQDLIQAFKSDQVSDFERDTYCKVGNFSKEEFKAAFPKEFQEIWSVREDFDSSEDEILEIPESGEDENEIMMENQMESTELNTMDEDISLSSSEESDEAEETDNDSSSTPKRGSPSKTVGAMKVKGKVRRKTKAAKKKKVRSTTTVSLSKAAGGLNSGKKP
jgi:hypothetical protein